MDVEAVLASFIVWLARRHLPEHERRWYREHVERYLRWLNERDMTGWDAAAAYCDHLRATGASAEDVRTARRAIELLDQQRGAQASVPR